MMRSASPVVRLAAAILLVAGAHAYAAEPPAAATADRPTATAPKKVFHLGQWERDIGYAQAVAAGPYLFVSGTVGRGDADDPDDWASALRTAYERIGVTLEAHGIGFDQVVKETIYTRDIEQLKDAAAARFDYYSKENLPASTWVQVERLFEPDLLVEIEVTAILP